MKFSKNYSMFVPKGGKKKKVLKSSKKITEAIMSGDLDKAKSMIYKQLRHRIQSTDTWQLGKADGGRAMGEHIFGDD